MTSTLKAEIEILFLFVSLMLVQYVVWLTNLVACCICINDVNIENAHSTRVLEFLHTCIPPKVWCPPLHHWYSYLHLFPVSIQPSLQWEVLPLMLRPLLFWVCWELQLGCTPPCTYTPTPFSTDNYGHLQYPPSCNYMCASL